MTTTTASADLALHAGALAGFDSMIGQLRPDQWTLPTPCTSWTVTDLVEHVIAEARWTPPLLAGQTIAEVGTSLDETPDRQHLKAAWTLAREAAADAARRCDAQRQVVHLSAGDTTADEYLRQLTADYLLHTWDLAVAIGADTSLDAELVAAVGAWFLGRQAQYRSAGAVGAQVTVAPDGHPQTRLLAMFGRDEASIGPLPAVGRFDKAFAQGDVDAIMACMTVDCVFESTAPPDGTRHEGQSAVRAAWTEFFTQSTDAEFQTEEQFACGDRVVVRWRYTWAPGPAGHVRGIDVFRVRDGLVAEKLSYVKG